MEIQLEGDGWIVFFVVLGIGFGGQIVTFFIYWLMDAIEDLIWFIQERRDLREAARMCDEELKDVPDWYLEYLDE